MGTDRDGARIAGSGMHPLSDNLANKQSGSGGRSWGVLAHVLGERCRASEGRSGFETITVTASPTPGIGSAIVYTSVPD